MTRRALRFAPNPREQFVPIIRAPLTEAQAVAEGRLRRRQHHRPLCFTRHLIRQVTQADPTGVEGTQDVGRGHVHVDDLEGGGGEGHLGGEKQEVNSLGFFFVWVTNTTSSQDLMPRPK